VKSLPVYIGIGSNMGDRKANIDKAIGLVKLIKGVKMEKTSSVYETKPVGGPQQGKFLNGVLKIKTTIDPFKLLGELRKIEKHLGRKRKIKNGPRTIDLDILLFGKRKIDTRVLKVPHPRMHKREFVLRGLRELTP
jgi:2-amino-4-hydroxy-6-hydroxymethyldihydropteridine diphosphokinase